MEPTLMRTSNPALASGVFGYLPFTSDSSVMTVQGTATRTLILLGLAIISGAWTWHLFTAAQSPSAIMPWLWGGTIGGLDLALITNFKKEWSPVTAPLYALAEGLALGGISAVYSHLYKGIVFQAVTLTLGTAVCMLLAYKLGLVRASKRFVLGVVAATGAIMLVYVVSMVLSLFHITVPGIFGNGPIGIAFSVVVVIIAALNLVLDFNFIEEGAARGAPKYMEWYGAFGLMVTLVWLYLEILRLLSKMRER
jgi:uncharacterized YccA/Bax inhibitor family protein